jgi:type II secretory pathway pseudopilin PulG
MKNAKAGFSLLEAVIAIVIIVVAAVTALSYLVYCNRFASRTDARIVAANFARETMEGLYKKHYSDASLKITTGEGVEAFLPEASSFGEEFLRRYPNATRRYTVTDMGSYKLIKVKVEW